MTEGTEVPNREKIRTLGEREIYKYLRVLKVDSIRQADMKEKKKLKKNTSGERENNSNPNYIAEISLKG